MALQDDNYTDKVNEIIEEIRKNIKDRKMDGTIIGFQDVPQEKVLSDLDIDNDSFDPAKLSRYLDLINRNYMLLLERPFKSGSFIVNTCIKRIIRKMVRFYIIPIVSDQSFLNANIANVFHQIKNYICHQQNEIYDLRREINCLKMELEDKNK